MAAEGPAVRLTQEEIERFLGELRRKGRNEATLRRYRSVMNQLYQSLPEDKTVCSDTAAQWRGWMESRGLAPQTVIARISVWNSFALYLGHREWAMDGFFQNTAVPPPELTRAEYLRLLRTAKRLGEEQSYLLIKVLGTTGLRSKDLKLLTAEAVRRGSVDCGGERLALSESLREELLDYLAEERVAQGPVFAGPDGKPIAGYTVYYAVSRLSGEAQVPKEKASPRCLRELFRRTRRELRDSAGALVEQAYERLLEEEQLAAGWEAF